MDQEAAPALNGHRSFFRYAGYEAPANGAVIQRVLAIPNQRQPRVLVGFLTRPEIEAVFAAPDGTCWLGRRDPAFLIMQFRPVCDCLR